MPLIQLRLDYQASEQSLQNSYLNFQTRRLLFSIWSGNIDLIEKPLRKSKLWKISRLQIPILSVAILSGIDLDVIDHLLRFGCPIGDADSNGYTPMHLAVWTFNNGRNTPGRVIDYNLVHRLDLIDLFLNYLTKSGRSCEIFGRVFLDSNIHGMTPFLLACASGCVKIIRRFTSILDQSNESIPPEKLVDANGRNALHLILRCHENLGASTLKEMVTAIIKCMPPAMINWRNKDGLTPLMYWHSNRLWGLDMAKMLLDKGACLDFFDFKGRSLLQKAVEGRNIPFVDLLLRSGCRVNESGKKCLDSPLAKALHRPIIGFQSVPPSIEIIELLLAFGADLTQEFYLYIDNGKKSIGEDLEQEYSKCLQSMRVVPHMQTVDALREIRRSGILINLQRMCRVVIRRSLGNRADEVIGKLDCLPRMMKTFLLVRDDIKLMKCK